MSNRVICYRPEMNKVWGGTLPNLFVEQVKFWWEAMGRKPFYKYNDKPSKPNQFYKDGDSWQEELCWSRTELESARDTVAVKASPGDDKRELLKKHVIIYYRDSKNRLWYMFSEEVYYAKFAETYGIEQEPEEEAADDNGDQPTPPATPPECGHSAFANADIRRPDNNIDDSSEKTTDQSSSSGISSTYAGDQETTATAAQEPEDEAKLKQVSKLYEENIGVITPLTREILIEWSDKYPLVHIEYALKECVSNNVRRISYAQSILDRIERDGFDAVNRPPPRRPSTIPREKTTNKDIIQATPEQIAGVGVPMTPERLEEIREQQRQTKTT